MVFDNQQRKSYISCDWQIKLTHGLHVDGIQSVTALSINLGRELLLMFQHDGNCFVDIFFIAFVLFP